MPPAARVKLVMPAHEVYKTLKSVFPPLVGVPGAFGSTSTTVVNRESDTMDALLLYPLRFMALMRTTILSFLIRRKGSSLSFLMWTKQNLLLTIDAIVASHVSFIVNQVPSFALNSTIYAETAFPLS